MEHAASDALNAAERGVGASITNADSQQSGPRHDQNACNHFSDAASAADLAASDMPAGGTAQPAGGTAQTAGGAAQPDASTTPLGGDSGDDGTPVPSHALGSPFATSSHGPVLEADDTHAQPDSFQEGAQSEDQGGAPKVADRQADPSDSLIEGHARGETLNAAMGSSGASAGHVNTDTSAVPAGNLPEEQRSVAADVDTADVDNADVDNGANNMGAAPDLTVVGRGIAHSGAGDISLPL